MPRPRCLLALVLIPFLAGPGVLAEEEPAEPEITAEMDRDALEEILRTRQTTPALAESLKALHYRKLGWALTFAASGAEGSAILTVIEHILATGVLSHSTLSYMEVLAGAEVCLEGSLRRLTHPDLHAYVLEVDVRRVLQGELTLTPDNTPLRILVGALGNHRRWILTDWEPGTKLIVFASEGEVLFESRWVLVRGLRVVGDAAWPVTGREASILETLAPLGLREPGALLEGMQAEDETKRWLSTVRVLTTCRELGDPFPSWPTSGSCTLRRERVEGVREELVKSFAAVRDRLVWEEGEYQGRFRLAEQAPGGAR